MTTIVKQIQNRILRNLYQISYLQNQAEEHYQAAIKRHFPKLPILSNADLALVEAIRNEGVVITSLEALSILSTQKMFQSAQLLIPKIPRKFLNEEKEYVVHATSKQMMEYPEIFLWGLEERLVNIVENYIGLPVAYHGAYFRRDIANQVERKSRLWHIDTEDRKILKVIIYLNDVSDECGPFQYIPHSLTNKVASCLKYNSGYISDKTMQKALPPSYWKSCTGSAGTVIFAATGSIFHKGKIPITCDRFTIFFDYTSNQPKYPFYCKSSLPEEDLLLLENNLSEWQKQCVFWRQYLEQ